MSTSNISRRFLLTGWLCVTCSTVSLAQLPTATILGQVKDATGAVVPNATLRAQNVETGLVRSTTTAVDGSYRFSALSVGPYEVRAEYPGFRTQVRSGLTLAVGQDAVLHFTLEVGEVTQTVEVSAEAPLVNTTSGALGTLVDDRTVAQLPLNGRNYIDLAFLQAGVQMDSSTGSGGTTSRATMMNSNGANFRANNYLLDGAPMTTLNGNSSGDLNMRTLGVEGIREYRVVTNSFSAEYGLRMGAQAVFVSKNGTNQFHGSAFEYFRNSALDARNFFDYKTVTTPRRIPNFVRNNFGGSLGGPIRADKTFFFLVYEGLKESVGTSRLQRTIPAASRVDGAVVNGVVIPQIDPVSRPFLQFYPLPNFGTDQFTFAPSDRSGEDHGQARADHNFSESDQIFARYTTTHSFRNNPHALSPDHWVIDDKSISQFSTLSETHTFSPVLLGTFRASHSYIHIRETTGNEVRGPEFSFRAPDSVMGSLSVSGLPGIGTGATNGSIHKQHIFTWSGDLFYTRGGHLNSLKFGTLVNRFRLDFESPNNNVGSVAFSSLQNFLLGRPQSISARAEGSDSTGQFRYTTLGFYVQDDYRVTSRFALNMGLRYEFNTNIREKLGREANFRNMQTDTDTTVGPIMENFSLKNFGPRLGFAWDVGGTGQTALRGGFGLLYDVMNMGGAVYQAQGGTPPWSVFLDEVPTSFRLPLTFSSARESGPALRVMDYRMQQPHMMQYNLTVERQLPWAMAATLSYAGSRGFNLLRTREGNPRIAQIVDGQKYFPLGAARVNPRFASIELKVSDSNSWYNSMQFTVNKRLSNRIQFQSAYTWAHVLDEGQAVYSNEASRFPSDPDDRTRDRSDSGFDIRHNWRVNSIYLLPELSSSDGLISKLVNGWWISGIFSAQTGYPHEIVLGTNRSRSGNLGDNRANIDRPNLAPGRTPNDIMSGTSDGCTGVAPGTKLGTRQLFFDPCAFKIQPLGYLGNLGRNFLRRPGLYNIDFALAKDTPLRSLGETGKLEFRADFFNILNHASFQPGKETRLFATSATVEGTGTEAPIVGAGEMVSTSNKSRQIQLSLRIEF